jgi:hypothetical protein
MPNLFRYPCPEKRLFIFEELSFNEILKQVQDDLAMITDT